MFSQRPYFMNNDALYMVSSPPLSPWGDLQVLEPKMMGGEILHFPVMGGLRLSGGLPIIMGGLSI